MCIVFWIGTSVWGMNGYNPKNDTGFKYLRHIPSPAHNPHKYIRNNHIDITFKFTIKMAEQYFIAAELFCHIRANNDILYAEMSDIIIDRLPYQPIKLHEAGSI